MQKMMSGFDRGRQLTNGANGREGLVSFIKVMIIRAKTTDVFGDPEIQEMRGGSETMFNGIPVNSFKTSGRDGSLRGDQPVFHCPMRNSVA